MREKHVREVVSKIKVDIVARAAESRARHAEARALRGQERHEKQMERRAFGRTTRWLLLAYAWIRGKPYLRGEPRAVVPVDPWAVKRALATYGVEVEAREIQGWLRGEPLAAEATPLVGEGPSPAVVGAPGGVEWAASSTS